MNWFLRFFESESDKRGAHRFRVGFNDDIRFFGPEGEEIELIDISRSGIGLKNCGALESVSEGEKFDAKCVVGGDRLDVSVEVVRRTGTLVAGRLMDSENFFSNLSKVLDAEFAGHEAQKIKEEVLHRSEEGSPGWFREGAGNELYLMESSGQLLGFHLQFRDFFFQSPDGKALVSWKEEAEGRSPADELAKNEVVRFVENLSRLDTQLKSQIIALLNSPG